MSQNIVNPARLAIIAGGGQLPIILLKALQAQGRAAFLILIKDNAQEYLYQFPHVEIKVTDLKALLTALKQEKISHVTLAGSIKSRPQLRDININLTMIKAAPYLLKALGQGDDALLKAFIKILESYGYQILSSQEIAPQLLAPEACLLTKKGASKEHIEQSQLAIKAAKLLGSLDIGQASIAMQNRIIALEGPEGTDNMLKRVAEMRAQGKIAERGGVLVKCCKPQQDIRADLPAIGPLTVKNASLAKLDGIMIEAGAALIIERSQTIALADQENLFIQTFNASE